MTRQFYQCGCFFQYDRIGASSSSRIRLRETPESKLAIILNESVTHTATKYDRIHSHTLTKGLPFVTRTILNTLCTMSVRMRRTEGKSPLWRTMLLAWPLSNLGWWGAWGKHHHRV